VQHLPSPPQVMSLPQHGASAAQLSPFFWHVTQRSGLIDGLVVCVAVHVSAPVVPGTQPHSVSFAHFCWQMPSFAALAPTHVSPAPHGLHASVAEGLFISPSQCSPAPAGFEQR
jgi:hypothetical protein